MKIRLAVLCLMYEIIQFVGANGCNVHYHAQFLTFTICNSLICLPTNIQHCTGVTCDSSQGNAPGILWTD